MSDMFYAARKGVKAGNPDAKTITSGFAPISSYKLAADETIGTKSKTVLRKYGIESTADFMELIYKYIETGRFPSYLEKKSTDPDDYFDGVTIHAYDLGSSLVIAESRHPDDWYNSEPINTNDPDSTAFTTFHWLKAIETVYEVMQEHTDSEKRIWITEFGVTTHTKHLTQSAEPPVGHPYAMRMQLGSSNYAWYYTSDEYERQHAWIAEEYMKALNTLDCVHTCHFFRLHSPNADLHGAAVPPRQCSESLLNLTKLLTGESNQDQSLTPSRNYIKGKATWSNLQVGIQSNKNNTL